MEIDKRAVDAIDKLRDATEEGKLPRGVRDLLEGRLNAEEFQEASDEVRESANKMRETIEELESQAQEIETQADSIARVAEAIGEALDQVEEWEGAEGRDEKTQARESLLDSLASVVEAFDEIEDVGEVGGLDADGYDILSPEQKAYAVLVEQLAHAALADWLIESRAEVLARLPEGEGIPRKDTLASEVNSIIGVLELRGIPDPE